MDDTTEKKERKAWESYLPPRNPNIHPRQADQIVHRGRLTLREAADQIYDDKAGAAALKYRLRRNRLPPPEPEHEE